jgi:phage terminase small subunit
VKFLLSLRLLSKRKKEIDSNGLLNLDKKGEQKKNPAVDIHKQYLDLFDRKIQQLGLTPYLRSKLQKMMATNIDDGFDEE